MIELNTKGEETKFGGFWINYPYPDKKFSPTRFEDRESLENQIGTKQFRLDTIYLEMAEVWSRNSYCERSKVGCLIVSNKSIISDGYNGTPSGFPNRCEDENNKTISLVLHAEANAITKLAKGNHTSVGSTLYVTLSPCYECSKLIIQSGIKRVVFRSLYRNLESLDILSKSGIEIVRIEK